MVNILNFSKTNLQKAFMNKYAGKDYFNRYINLYRLTAIPELLVLIVSAVLSWKWWESIAFVQDYAGSLSPIIAGFFTVFVSVSIWYLTTHQAQLLLSESQPDIWAIPLVLLIIFNVYTDWNGVPALSEKIHALPVFEQSREDQLNQKIDAIYHNYSWCGKHNTKHQCEFAVVPGSPGQLTKSYERWGFHPTEDRQTIVLYQDQIRRLNNDYSTTKNKAVENRKKFTKTGRGGTLVCLTIFLFLSYWRHNFEFKAQKVSANQGGTPGGSETSYITNNNGGNGSQPLPEPTIHYHKDFQNEVVSTPVTTDSETRTCPQCEENFEVNLRKDPANNPRKYCSKACKNEAGKERTYQERERKKFKISN